MLGRAGAIGNHMHLQNNPLIIGNNLNVHDALKLVDIFSEHPPIGKFGAATNLRDHIVIPLHPVKPA